MSAVEVRSDEEQGQGKLARGARQYGKSAYTPVKQAHFAEIATMVTCAVRAIWDNPRYNWAYRRLAYFDLHAGPGLDDDGDLGSPLLMMERTAVLGVPLDAVLFEQDARRAAQLMTCVAARQTSGWARVYHGRCEEGLPAAIAALQRRAKLAGVYGLLYADPTTVVPWQTLGQASVLLPRVDVLISLPAATEKRIVGAGLIEPEAALRSALGKIDKDKWFIRTLMERHQFTFLLGTNYADMKAIKRIGLVPLQSEQGQRLFRAAAYTHAERQAGVASGQLGLPGLARMPLGGE